jgi:hypothetical protein
MKRIVLLLCAVAGVSALAGCVGYIPVAEPAPSVVVRSAPPPHRAMRDSDGDGVPNRYDRRPSNPYRY